MYLSVCLAFLLCKERFGAVKKNRFKIEPLHTTRLVHYPIFWFRSITVIGNLPSICLTVVQSKHSDPPRTLEASHFIAEKIHFDQLAVQVLVQKIQWNGSSSTLRFVKYTGFVVALHVERKLPMHIYWRGSVNNIYRLDSSCNNPGSAYSEFQI